MILQHDKPDDFVVATEETYTVREFLAEAFGILNLDWQDFVEIESRFIRPAEVPDLLGNAEKIKRVLGWKPKVKFKELCKMMLEADLQLKGLTIERARKMAEKLKISKQF